MSKYQLDESLGYAEKGNLRTDFWLPLRPHADVQGRQPAHKQNRNDVQR